jgi:ketosteroid isomerase-like protein
MINKTTLICVLLLVRAGFGSCSLCAQPKTHPGEKDDLFLKKFRRDYVDKIMNNNPTALEVYYADSIRLMPPFQKTIIGKKGCTAFLQAFLDRFIVSHFSKTEVEIVDMGNQLMEIGTIVMQVTLKNNGSKHELRGKYMDLWLKKGEGEMLLLSEIWNYDAYYGDIHDQLRFDVTPSLHQAMLGNVPITNSIRFELAAYNRLLDATVTQHDAATWALYYTDDAMLLSSYEPIIRGKEAIKAYLEKHAKELPHFVELDIRSDRVDDLGPFIVEYASHIASLKNSVSLGKNIRVWQRQPDHSLKMIRSIGNYD